MPWFNFFSTLSFSCWVILVFSNHHLNLSAALSNHCFVLSDVIFDFFLTHVVISPSSSLTLKLSRLSFALIQFYLNIIFLLLIVILDFFNHHLNLNLASFNHCLMWSSLVISRHLNSFSLTLEASLRFYFISTLSQTFPMCIAIWVLLHRIIAWSWLI